MSAAIAETGLNHHHEYARADVERTIATLRAERLLPQHGRSIALEYPIASSTHDGTLLTGMIDFLSSDGISVDVIDFKTDHPPAGDVKASHAAYVAQAQCYVDLLRTAELKVGRMGLLFQRRGER